MLQQNALVWLSDLPCLAHTEYLYTASQNEATVKNLRLGLILPSVISLFFRLLFRRDSFPPSKGSLALYLATFFPAFFLSNYLIKIGTTRRDPTTGTLISYGEDLNQPGLTEWAFDVLYITCQLRFTTCNLQPI